MGGGARAWGAELAGLRREGALLWRLAPALAARACAISSRSPEAMAMAAAAAAFLTRSGGAPRGEGAGLGLASARLLGGPRGSAKKGGRGRGRRGRRPALRCPSGPEAGPLSRGGEAPPFG